MDEDTEEKELRLQRDATTLIRDYIHRAASVFWIADRQTSTGTVSADDFSHSAGHVQKWVASSQVEDLVKLVSLYRGLQDS